MANTFHVALYVKDMDAAIARYTKLLGQEPAKVRHDYAKFEIADPPIIFSLNTGGEPGTVSSFRPSSCFCSIAAITSTPTSRSPTSTAIGTTTATISSIRG